MTTKHNTQKVVMMNKTHDKNMEPEHPVYNKKKLSQSVFAKHRLKLLQCNVHLLQGV